MAKTYTVGRIKKELKKIFPDCTVNAQLPILTAKVGDNIAEIGEPDRITLTFNYDGKEVVVYKKFSMVEYLEDGTSIVDSCEKRPSHYALLEEVHIAPNKVDKLFVDRKDLKPAMAEHPEFDRAVGRADRSIADPVQ